MWGAAKWIRSPKPVEACPEAYKPQKVTIKKGLVFDVEGLLDTDEALRVFRVCFYTVS